MKTLVLGIGNPIVTDDAVGLKVAQSIKRANPELEVVEACSGAMGLFDYITDCDRLIIIDSVKTEGGKPGTLYKIDMEDLKPKLNHAASHGLDIATAFKLGEGLGYRMPQNVSIYAVEAKDNTNFGEGCTKEVSERIPHIAAEIMEEENLKAVSLPNPSP
jgi:hydrogenase maturation protease